MNHRTLLVVIMDGFGINENTKGNAIAAANKPNLDSYIKKYPWSKSQLYITHD